MGTTPRTRDVAERIAVWTLLLLMSALCFIGAYTLGTWIL